ncbi:MAG: hypothetical protein CMI31_04925 [Opitutae bacterium]|nr:hypothetical protein [Opitutae bacterium]
MQNNFIIGLVTCVFATLLGGCFSFKEKFSAKPFELQEVGLIEAVPVISKVANTSGLAFQEEGTLYFSNYSNSGTIGVYKVDDATPPSTFIDLNEWMTSYDERTPDVHGLAMDADGCLIGADAGTGKVIRVSPDASKVEVLADSYKGMLFGSVRDVALSSNGTVYASSPDEGVIYKIFPEKGKVDILNRDMVRADGLAITPDGTRLVVTEPDAARLLVYSLENELSGSVPVATLDFSGPAESPQGVAFDQTGHLYVAMGDLGLVHVFDLADSRLLRTYQTGGTVDRLVCRDGTLWLSGGRSQGIRKIRLN